MNETRKTICQCRNKCCSAVVTWEETAVTDKKEHVCPECGRSIRVIQFANKHDGHYVEMIAKHYLK